jgi:predicted PurR-regulated permease PerM
LVRFEQVRANIRRAYAAGRDSVRAARVQAKASEVLEERDELAQPVEPVEPARGHPSTVSRDDADVPRGLRIAAAWCWRVLVIGIVGWALLRVVGLLSHVIVPLAIALLLSALLSPAVHALRRSNLPPSLATFLVLITGMAAVVGTLTLVINQFVSGLPDLAENAREGIKQIQGWLKTGPLHLSDAQLTSALDSVSNYVRSNRSTLTTGAVNTATSLFDVLAGLFLVLFSTFFFLRDGRRIWRAVVSVFPAAARGRVGAAGDASWLTLVAYVRATVLVAFIDAVGIGLACAILRVPFAFPLAALVFLAAFIPIVGATLSGAVAVLVALVAKGPLIAVILLGAVILVQQVEGHLLQPLIMGRAVAIHPLAVIVSIAAGVLLAGIIGALVAVPLVAVLNTAIRRLMAPRVEPPPDAVIVTGDQSR